MTNKTKIKQGQCYSVCGVTQKQEISYCKKKKRKLLKMEKLNMTPLETLLENQSGFLYRSYC